MICHVWEKFQDKIEQKVLLESFKDKQARDKYLKNAAEWRIMLYNFINSKFFVNFMLGAIVISIVAIFLLTFESIAIRYGKYKISNIYLMPNNFIQYDPEL